MYVYVVFGEVLFQVEFVGEFSIIVIQYVDFVVCVLCVGLGFYYEGIVDGYILDFVDVFGV